MFEEAQEIMPGGVSSPVRAFKSVGGNPVVFDRVKGPYAWDVDGGTIPTLTDRYSHMNHYPSEELIVYCEEHLVLQSF